MVAFLMKDEKLPYHEALSKVKAGRKWANPNSGFRQQLIKYNEELGLAPPPPEFLPAY